MQLLKKFQFFFLFLNIFYSCNLIDKQEAQIGEMDFGEVNPGKVVEKTLMFDFNSAAQKDKNAYLEFGFVDISGKSIQGIKFKLGDKVLNDKFKISPADLDPNGKVRIGIVFPPNAKEQDYFGYLMLTDASNELKQNISLNDTANIVNLNNKIADFHAKFEIPMERWLYWTILLVSIFSILGILVFIVTRNNMPFGKKTFKYGTIGFPDGDFNSVKLEKLSELDLSKIFGIQSGLTLEPYDKRIGSAKKRFARIRNKTDLIIKINYDGSDQVIGATEDFYNMDELKIHTPENKIHHVSYTNNKNIRTFNS
jgi:hypothetical protein